MAFAIMNCINPPFLLITLFVSNLITERMILIERV